MKKDSILQRLLRRKAHKKKGQSLIIVALAIVMIFALLAVTLNVQQLTSDRATIQTAADSAALAGANMQAQGKELIKVCEMLRFVRDAVIALIRSVAIVIRDIGYVIIGIGVVADAASPFCFCAGMWAFPIATEVLDAADEVDTVADEAESATEAFYEGLGTAEDIVADVVPFLAVVNAYEYGQQNGAAFTLPVPLPITDKKNGAFEMKTDPQYSAILKEIQKDKDRIKQIREHDIPTNEYALLDDLKTYDVLSLKIDRHDDARLKEAIKERNSTSDPDPVTGQTVPICVADPFFNPCPKLDDEIAAATAQQNSPNPDDNEALQKAKDDFHNAGCDGPNPPPASTCDPLQKAIDDSQKQLDNDKQARDNVAVLSGNNVVGGDALQYQNNINNLKGEQDALQKDVQQKQVDLENARKAAADKSAQEINERDLSFGRAGMEGIMVIVVKKSEKPIVNFGSDTPMTWAAAFGLTVTTSDPAKIYGHTNMNLIDALGQANGGLAGALTSIGSWASALMISFSKQFVDTDAEVENWLKNNVGPVYDFLKWIGLPIFNLTRPDIHDVRARLVKVDAGFITSMARVDTSDAYALEDKLPDTLNQISDIIKQWQELAQKVGVSGISPADFPITVDFSENNLF